MMGLFTVCSGVLDAAQGSGVGLELWTYAENECARTECSRLPGGELWRRDASLLPCAHSIVPWDCTTFGAAIVTLSSGRRTRLIGTSFAGTHWVFVHLLDGVVQTQQ